MKLLKHISNVKHSHFEKEDIKEIEVDNQKMEQFLDKSSAIISQDNMKVGDEKTFTKNNILCTQYRTNEGLFEKSTFNKNNYTNINYEGFIKNTKSFKQKAYVNITIHERVYSNTIKIKEINATIKYENKEFEHLKHSSHIMKAEDSNNEIFKIIDEIEEYLDYQKQIKQQNILNSFKYNDNQQTKKEIENIENALNG